MSVVAWESAPKPVKPVRNLTETLFTARIQENEPSYGSSLRVWADINPSLIYERPFYFNELEVPDNSLYKLFVSDFKSKESVFALSQLSSLLSQKIGNGQYNEIAYLMNKLSLGDVSTTMQIALLRYTYRVRNDIENWLSFRDRVKKELDIRCENTQQLLIGLL